MLDLTISNKNPKEFVKQVWKILEIECISLGNLIETICFNIKLPIKPSDIINLINQAKKEGIILEKSGNLYLSEELKKELIQEELKVREDITWRFNKFLNTKRIEDNIDTWYLLHEIDLNKNISQKISKIDDKISMKYNDILKGLFSNEEINNGKKISNDNLNFVKIDENNEYIEIKIKGSQAQEYILIIDGKNKLIKHDCYNFKYKKSQDKQLCKHIFKTLHLLKVKNFNLGFKLVNLLKDHLNEFEFKF